MIQEIKRDITVDSPLSCFETEVWMDGDPQTLHRLRLIHDATNLCWIQSLLWSKDIYITHLPHRRGDFRRCFKLTARKHCHRIQGYKTQTHVLSRVARRPLQMVHLPFGGHIPSNKTKSSGCCGHFLLTSYTAASCDNNSPSEKWTLASLAASNNEFKEPVQLSHDSQLIGHSRSAPSIISLVILFQIDWESVGHMKQKPIKEMPPFE